MASLLRAFLLLWLISALAYADTPSLQTDPATASPNWNKPSVFLLTIAPGEVYWEHFGHNALIVDPSGQDLPGPDAIAYNFGFFDMNEAGFIGNFIQGRMTYRGVRTEALSEMRYYQSDARSMWLQRLDLSPPQVQKLEQFLRDATTPPADRYQYDYFRNNCSTRVRDALDFALDGQLKTQSENRSSGQTFRSLGLAHAAPTFWMYSAIHLGLGPRTDRALTFYEEYFIPSKLMLGLKDKRIRESAQDPTSERALVLSTNQIGTQELPQAPLAPNWRYWFLLAGLLIAIGTAAAWQLAEKRQGFARTLLLSPASLVAACVGIGGAVLLYLQFTTHYDAHWNLNLALLNPLWLAAVPGVYQTLGKRWAVHVLNVALALALIGFAIKVLPAVRQQNLDWNLLLLPILVVLWSWRRPTET